MGIKNIVAVAFIGTGDSGLAIARAVAEINTSMGYAAITVADVESLVQQQEPKFDARLELEKLMLTNPYSDLEDINYSELLYGNSGKPNLKLKAKYDARKHNTNKASSKSKISPRASASLRKGRCRSR